MENPSNKEETPQHLGRVYLYPVGIALYWSSLLGFVALTFFMAFYASSNNYIQLVDIILYYAVPLTLVGVLVGYFIGFYAGSKVSLLAAILVLIYFIYYVGTNELASSPQSNYDSLVIIWFFITIMIGRGIYTSQARLIRFQFRKTHKKQEKFDQSYFRLQISKYFTSKKYNNKIQGSILFATAFLIASIAIAVSILLEDMTVYLAFVSAFLLYAYVQSNSLRDNILFPLSSFLLLITFIILGLFIAPLFAGSLLVLYLNGEIVTFTIIGILAILILLAYLGFKDISMYKKIKSINKSTQLKSSEQKLKLKDGKVIYKKFSRINKELRVSIAIIFPLIVVLLIFSSITIGQSFSEPNLSPRGLTGVGNVEMYNPYGGYVFYEPHGSYFTLVLRFNISNNLNNYRNEPSIENISISHGESHLLEVMRYSTSLLPIGITYVYVTVYVIGSSFSGLVDLSVEVQ